MRQGVRIPGVLCEVARRLDAPYSPEESDGTVLARLLRERGPDGLRGISAMFALARHDPEDGSLLLVRDAWGQKPLYHRTLPDGTFLFGSTLSAIHAAGGPLRVRADAVDECLLFKSVGGCLTGFEGVEQIRKRDAHELDRSLQGVARAPREVRLDPDDRAVVLEDDGWVVRRDADAERRAVVGSELAGRAATEEDHGSAQRNQQRPQEGPGSASLESSTAPHTPLHSRSSKLLPCTHNRQFLLCARKLGGIR